MSRRSGALWPARGARCGFFDAHRAAWYGPPVIQLYHVTKWMRDELARRHSTLRLEVACYDNVTPQMAPYYEALWARARTMPNVKLLGSLRQATKGARAFYQQESVEGGVRWKVIDAGLLLAIGRVKNGGPVNTWLDQIVKSKTAWLPFCKAVIATADPLGVEVIR